MVKNSKAYYFHFVLILVIAVGIRMIGLDKGIWCDEYSSLSFSHESDLMSTLSKLRENDHPPLYFLMLKYWSRYNSGETFLRLLSLAFGMGFILVTMAWLKPYNRPASLLTGLYLSTAPMMIRFSQEIRGYALLLFATALAFYFAAWVIRQPEKISGYAGLMLSLTMAISTHLIGIFLMAPIIGYIVFSLNPKKLRPLAAAATMAVPVAAFIFFHSFYLELVDKDASWWIPPVTWDRITRIAGQYFFQPWRSLPDVAKTILLWGTFLLPVLPLFWGNKTKKPYFLLVAALLYWLQIIGYSLVKVPVLLHRTALPGVLPFVGFITLQICSISNKTVKTSLVLIYIILCCNAGLFWLHYYAGKPNEQLREVSQKLASQWHPGDKVVFWKNSEKHVRYYFTELPDDAVWHYRNGIIVTDHKPVTPEGSPSPSSLEASFSVFFVARIYRSAANGQHPSTLHHKLQLLSYNTLVNMLKDKFGPPVYQRWFKAYMLMEFSVPYEAVSSREVHESKN